MEQGEARVSNQHTLREPLLRLGAALQTAMASAEDPALIVPVAGSSGAELEFYSCDILAGPAVPLEPREPIRYRYRLQRQGADCWLARFDEGGLTQQGRRRLSQGVELRFTNLGDRALEVEASSLSQWRDARQQSHEAHLKLKALLPIPDAF